MTDKEIIIDGIKYFKQSDINKGLDEEHYVTEFHLLATHYNLLLEDYARKYNRLKEQLKRKEQECEHWKNQCLCLDGEDVTVQISQEQFEEYQNYKQALDEIEKFIIYEFSGQNQWVKKNVLGIINKAKEKTNEKYN